MKYRNKEIQHSNPVKVRVKSSQEVFYTFKHWTPEEIDGVDFIIDCGCVEPNAVEYKSTFNFPVLRKGTELESLSLKLCELLSANGVIFIANVVFVTAKPDTESISVDELNENVESLETADPDVEELGVNKTGCAKLEFPALAIRKLFDVVAYPESVPVTVPLFIKTLEILEAELTYKLPPIPTPPVTINAPVVVDVEAVVPRIFTS